MRHPVEEAASMSPKMAKRVFFMVSPYKLRGLRENSGASPAAFTAS
jgi:hypothetical protein